MCLTVPLHRPGQRVFESGCGVGAFLQALQVLYGTTQQPLVLSGVDFSQKALAVAKTTLSQDPSIGSRLHHSAVQKLWGVPPGSFDVVVSFSVFGYLPDEAAVLEAANEMLRVVKPGGRIMIGNINNADSLGLADCMGTQKMFVRKQMWHEWAATHRSAIETMEIVDGYDTWAKLFGYDMAARFRYSVYVRKRGGVNEAG